MSAAALALPLDPAKAVPEWIELIPAGAQVSGYDGRSWSNPDPARVVAASDVERRPLPLDWEHATELRAANGLDAPAAGWIDRLEVRGGAIWGHVAWTALALNQVASRHYRFVSPVFAFARADGRILRLTSVALTNTPNLPLKALNWRQVNFEEDAAMDAILELQGLLGLGAQTTPDDVVAAVRGLVEDKAANRVDPSRFVPIETFEAVTRELNARNQGLSAELAEEHVSKAIGSAKMIPALRDWGVALCKVNRPAFDQFIERTGGSIQKMFEPSRIGGKPPAGQPALSDTDAQIARQLGHAPAEMNRQL